MKIADKAERKAGNF